ncbi:nascent polypeptide-associated complex subunit alpha, muscle-specific form isoform X4 [Cryptotermes secundus]|uniref:nascent polypeptide-associated complex subunit alpha, muscle-specific form isoform X4 n=1 Tax=Cryptotermes secundus TaxID=105785 RepID=UPI000CD7C131|nr:nascent polypeptide-associated complex subunit alpha, muscle-specific form isoform X4 [Cryptotermes secundus]
MSPLYIAVILIISACSPPCLAQGYGPLPHKGKKHRTTTTTTLPPDIASLDVDGQQYQPAFINPVSSPVPDNSLGSYSQPASPPEGGGSYWWQNPNSPFSGVSPPSSAQPSGCGPGVAGGCGSTPVNIQGNPFLSGLKPGGAPPVNPSGQTVTCSGRGYICSPKHLCVNGVVVEDGQGLIQVRSEIQYCNAASEVCCRLPAGPEKPSSCDNYGSGSSCGGNVVPSQPGLVHVTPSSSQPGLVHVTPSSSQPGLVHVTPSSSQPGLIHISPSPNQPGLIHVPPPSKPSFPVSEVQRPSASIPSVTYAPSNNFGRPVPGTYGVPIGGSIYDSTRQPVTPTPNPSPYTGPLNTTPHPGCAAALKCVPETYCTADGVMADHPVTLTREQYENRVPLSECADPDTGAIGKCCRDPNYKDPWPGGMMMKNTEDGHQHQHQQDECGAAASCLHPYQCGNQYKIQPAKSCRVPLDGASGICCSNHQSAFPGETFISGSTPLSQKPVKKPSIGYPQPKPVFQPLPQPASSSPQPFLHVAPSSPQPFPQHVPSSPQPFPQHVPSSPQPFPQHVPSSPQPSPSSPQPFPQHVPSSPQPFPQHVPSSPQPFPQHVPSSPQPFPQHVPSSPQPFPQPSPSSPQPAPQPSPQPFPQYLPSSPQQFPEPSPQPYPQSKPSHEPFPQPTPQPSQPIPSAQPPTYPKPVKSVHPKPQPTQPQPLFTRPTSPQPLPHPGSQSHFPVPRPESSFPSRPSTGYPQPGVECGIRRQVSRQGLGDTDSGFGEFPWQALVLSNSNQSALCSAAVISDKAVITAANCLHNLESSDIVVEVGAWRLLSSDQPKPIQVVQVAAIARHPSFDAGSFFNDLAVLILGKQLKFDDHIDKICLPPKDQDVTQFQRTCIATGWGKKALQGNVPGSILHQVPVRLIPHSTCEDILRQTHLGRYFILNPSFQCALPTAQSQDLCKVDVGGPIACDQGDGHHVLSGLYSWDVGCNVPSSPTVLSGIDVAWIESILGRPVDELVRNELNEILRQQQQQDLGNVDTESKPGFSQGYGKK